MNARNKSSQHDFICPSESDHAEIVVLAGADDAEQTVRRWTEAQELPVRRSIKGGRNLWLPWLRFVYKLFLRCSTAFLLISSTVIPSNRFSCHFV